MFAIPAGTRWLLYAPLRKSAALCNQALVNLVADLAGKKRIARNPENLAALNFLQEFGVLNGEPSAITHDPVEPTEARRSPRIR